MTVASILRSGSALLALAILPGCGLFAMQKDHEKEAKKVEELAKINDQQKAEIAALRSDLEATRERLDNATRAYADKGDEIVNQKQKVNLLTGRVEESSQVVEGLRKDLASFRTEVNGRLDELKRSAEAQATKPAPPPTPIPADKGQHFAAIEAAYGRQDWTLTRTLGREFLNRYPTDDKADDALYMMGDGEMKEGRPSSALGEFNRLIKLNQKSNVLDKTLFAMGEAYLLMHDCENAKLAYQACLNRFAKEPLGVQSKQKIATIDKKPAGMCAPQ
jgi:TolA-binding protein